MSRGRRRRGNPGLLPLAGAADFVSQKPLVALALGGVLLWALAPKQTQQAVSSFTPGVTLPTAPSWLQGGIQKVTGGTLL